MRPTLSLPRSIWLVVIVVVWHFLPKPSLLSHLSRSTAIYDRHGTVLRVTLTSDGKYRLNKPLAAISSDFLEATLDHEDRYFYWHPGVNLGALLSALKTTYFDQGPKRGGSTITMQLARILYRINSRSILGKLKQIGFAIWLELIYTKRQILEAYVNLAPYGGNIEGVEAAAFIYFKKSAANLSAVEAITLAVIPQSPTRRTLRLDDDLNESNSFARARERLKQKWLARHANSEGIAAASLPWPRLKRTSEAPFFAPHFVADTLRRHTEDDEIRTTLDLPLQQTIERVTSAYLNRRRPEGLQNASVMVVNYKSMEILTYLGSADFFNSQIDGQVNGAEARRSPGSTLKPFIYGLAMDQGLIHSRSILKDTPVSYAGFDPENSDNEFVGPISVHDALIRSRNIPAIDVASKLSEGGLYQFLQRMGVKGLKPPEYYGMSIAIGGAEMTMTNLVEMYASLANFGEVKKIRRTFSDSDGTGQPLISPEASFAILQILGSNPRPDDFWSSAGSSRDRIPVYWKTGTSYSYRDAWTVGIAGPYVIAVWLGNFNNQSNPALKGREAAAPLFFQIVDAMTPRKEMQNLGFHTPPNRIKQIQVCALSGEIPGHHCKVTTSAWYIPQRSPLKVCQIHREISVNPLTGLRTCRPSASSTRMVAEFWPTDLLNVFSKGGIGRTLPPAYEPGCELSDRDGRGMPPIIHSPRAEVTYEIDLTKPAMNSIAFQAEIDTSARRVYWYVGKSLVGSSNPGEPLYWTPSPGEFIVQAVDDVGRTSKRRLIVEAL